MKRSDKVWYVGMLLLSMALAGICVSQIIQGAVMYAVAAAVILVFTFYSAIDGLLVYYLERLGRFIMSQKDK